MIDVAVTVNSMDVTLMDIVRVDGDVLYVSGDANVTTRLQTLDFDTVYSRQP